MTPQLINFTLLSPLRSQAKANDRLRQHFDLRTSVNDGSQRMLNVLEPGTKVPIHRHPDTSETAICLEGCLDWIFYDEQPSNEAEHTDEERHFVEVARYRICPREQQYGIQIPAMAWHSIEVYEPSTIFEAKDGAYKG